MEEIMTPFEMAALLKIHVKTVYKLAEKGVIPGDRIGRSWRFSKRAILSQVSSRQKRRSGAIRGSAAAKDFPKK